MMPQGDNTLPAAYSGKPPIRPIETSYAGYRFRSRLEARWAVWFAALGLHWEYEAQGYDLGTTGEPGDQVAYGWYLPDFEVEGVFVEIKPRFVPPVTDKNVDLFISSGMIDALVKLPRLARVTSRTSILISGNPWPGEYLVNPFISDDPYFADVDGWRFEECRRCNGIGLSSDQLGQMALLGCTCTPEQWKGNAGVGNRLRKAFTAARSARFEHGECG